MQSKIDLFSQLLRELEAEIGTRDVNDLSLRALQKSIEYLKANDAQKFCSQFEKLLYAVLLFTIFQIAMGTQVREMTDFISKAQGEELRSTWVQAMPWFFYVHRSFSAIVLFANLWMGWLLYRSLGLNHSLTKLALGMIVVVSIAIASGATLGHLGMPAFVQPTHLLASALLFGLQFLIWMSYRHARNAKTSGELAAA